MKLKICRSKLTFQRLVQEILSTKQINFRPIGSSKSHLSSFGVRLGLDLDLINADHNTILACLSSLNCASQGLETHAVTHLQRQPLIGHELKSYIYNVYIY